MFGLSEVLQTVQAEVPETGPGRQAPFDKRTGRVRQQDLPAIRRRGDPGGPVDVQTQVIGATQDPLPGVEPDPDVDIRSCGPDRRGDLTLSLDCGPHRAMR